MRSFLRSLLVTSTSGLSQEEGLFLGFDVKKVAGGLERRLGRSILGVAGQKLQRQEEGACLEITARMLAGGEHRALIAVSCLHPQASAECPPAERPPWPRGYIPVLPVGPWLE